MGSRAWSPSRGAGRRAFLPTISSVAACKNSRRQPSTRDPPTSAPTTPRAATTRPTTSSDERNVPGPTARDDVQRNPSRRVPGDPGAGPRPGPKTPGTILVHQHVCAAPPAAPKRRVTRVSTLSRPTAPSSASSSAACARLAATRARRDRLRLRPTIPRRERASLRPALASRPASPPEGRRSTYGRSAATREGKDASVSRSRRSPVPRWMIRRSRGVERRLGERSVMQTDGERVSERGVDLAGARMRRRRRES